MVPSFGRRYRILIIPFVVLLVTGVITLILLRAPYPSLTVQRKALAKKLYVTPTRILDSAAIVRELKFLSSDTCEGRRPGTKGHDKAVERIVQRMKESGLDSFRSSMIQEFSGSLINNTRVGKNIIGWIKGTEFPKKYIVLSAHFDHMGKQGDKTYYGADDNASGVACLLALAKYFAKKPHSYSLVFAAFDREERSRRLGSLY